MARGDESVTIKVLQERIKRWRREEREAADLYAKALTSRQPGDTERLIADCNRLKNVKRIRKDLQKLLTKARKKRDT